MAGCLTLVAVSWYRTIDVRPLANKTGGEKNSGTTDLGREIGTGRHAEYHVVYLDSERICRLTPSLLSCNPTSSTPAPILGPLTGPLLFVFLFPLLHFVWLQPLRDPCMGHYESRAIGGFKIFRRGERGGGWINLSDWGGRYVPVHKLP